MCRKRSFATGGRGHAEEQDMLSARIDDLTQLVQVFAAQHEKHAAAL